MTLPVVPGLPFKRVDPEALRHDVERRGFVSVPLDWDQASESGGSGGPERETIDIFYRLIPTIGGDPDDATKPVVLVINGGPGIPASFYRPLDYDYGAQRMPSGGLDRFATWTRTHRVLIADQRGTDGLSAPLDMDDPSLDAALVARLFSSDSHARDYLAVVDDVLTRETRYWVIAQSYGGMPGMQLVWRATRMPRGIVFSSSAVPFEDAMDATLTRRREQWRLNQHLRSVVPDIAERLAEVRAHLSAHGLEPDLVHGLYTLLGKDVPGKWEPGLVARLDKILSQDATAIRADMEAALETPSLLNYILSSVNFSPGETDRTLARRGSELIPFEPWMIDEHVMLISTGQDGGWRESMVAALDAAPPPATPFPDLATLRAALARTFALFTAADNDAFVPGDAYRERAERFAVPGRTDITTLPGGHHAIFLETGYQAFLAWAGSVVARGG